MKHYAETVRECTALIEGNGNYLHKQQELLKLLGKTP